MNSATLPRLTMQGLPLDTSPEFFGELRSSNDLLGNPSVLRERMAENGYLFLPGFLKREEVRLVRKSICEALAADGCFAPGTDVMDAISKPGDDRAFRPDIANVNHPLHQLIYGPRVMGFYDKFLGGAARHYDFTWMRTIPPGNGSQPHCDVIFMGRGTHNLYTAWVPLGDVPLTTGGLILLEGSHKDQRLRETYCAMDIDTACENHGGVHQVNAAGYPGYGALSEDAPAVQAQLGGRWLTAEFKMGDFLTFSVFTVHGSLDNQSNEVRLSSDSRYQLASDPVDERWIGENPPGHGGDSVRKLIC